MRFLVEAGDDHNVLGGLGATPLHIAAERGHLETWTAALIVSDSMWSWPFEKFGSQ